MSGSEPDGNWLKKIDGVMGEAWWLRRLVFKRTCIFPQHSPPPDIFMPFYQIWDWANLKTSMWWPFGRGQTGVRLSESERESRLHQKKSTALRDYWDDAMHQVHAKILTVAKTREHMYIPLEWIEDIINAIAYYSILRNATAHMHRKCF